MKQRTFLLLEITHTEKASDLVDKVAGRAWTLDGVEMVDAKVITPEQAQRVKTEKLDQIATTYMPSYACDHEDDKHCSNCYVQDSTAHISEQDIPAIFKEQAC